MKNIYGAWVIIRRYEICVFCISIPLRIILVRTPMRVNFFLEIRKLKKCQRLPEQILDANEQEQPLKPKIFFGIIMDVG